MKQNSVKTLFEKEPMTKSNHRWLSWSEEQITIKLRDLFFHYCVEERILLMNEGWKKVREGLLHHAAVLCARHKQIVKAARWLTYRADHAGSIPQMHSRIFSLSLRNIMSTSELQQQPSSLMHHVRKRESFLGKKKRKKAWAISFWLDSNIVAVIHLILPTVFIKLCNYLIGIIMHHIV